MRKYLVLITAFALSGIVDSFAQSAEDLLGKMDALMLAPKDKQSHFKMTLLDRNGRGKVREADLFQKGTGERLTRYTKPETQAGISTLFLPEGKGVMWLYMPALGNPKKISGLANSQAFNNTDFALEDMASTPYSDRYTPALLETTSKSYLLELIPKDEKSGYSKIIITSNIEFFYPETIEYFDRGGRKFKVAVYEYERVGKYWNARKVVMTNIKKEHSTKIEILTVKFDQGLDDSLFLVENLRPSKDVDENVPGN